MVPLRIALRRIKLLIGVVGSSICSNLSMFPSLSQLGLPNSLLKKVHVRESHQGWGLIISRHRRESAFQGFDFGLRGHNR
jgi:hypothetical protein